MEKRRAGVPARPETAKAVAAAVAAKLAASKADKILQKMRKNPQGDWAIGDLQNVADGLGLTMTSPTRGSHYKVSSPRLPGILTVPAAKPIKPPYVRKFVALCLSHTAAAAKDEENG
ncbi:hypothetical protein [Mesorhizobium sp. M1163]|uniref:hypothetical protein n=1 Tax=Mesorhizobium sp. M1163 TaxID=2957065 RepID=UPI0033355D94